MKTVIYDQFPIKYVAICILFSVVLYALGAYILTKFGVGVVILYLLYCLYVEVNVLYRSCRSCFYFGKLCAFGKGWMCSKLFKKDDPKKFTEKEISFLAMIPDFLVVIFPAIGGIMCLVSSFSWFCLALLIVFIVLFMSGTALIRGSFACKYCRQRELGCPAEQLFHKTK